MNPKKSTKPVNTPTIISHNSFMGGDIVFGTEHAQAITALANAATENAKAIATIASFLKVSNIHNAPLLNFISNPH